MDEFQFFLAEQLGKDLEEIRAMPNLEYMQWSIYFRRKAQRRQIGR